MSINRTQAFFCFVFFVATKKMTLLSGNPDGFAFSLRLQSPINKEQQINDLLPPLQLQLLTPNIDLCHQSEGATLQLPPSLIQPR